MSARSGYYRIHRQLAVQLTAQQTEETCEPRGRGLTHADSLSPMGALESNSLLPIDHPVCLLARKLSSWTVFREGRNRYESLREAD
jgi:hypothetical protein